MTAQPWFKFYPGDWRADTQLRSCTPAARCLWLELLCVMHEAEPRGHLLVNGRAPNERALVILTGMTPREINAGLRDLEAHGVFSRTGEGVLFSRKMVRDTERAERDKTNGRGGGNPALKGQRALGVNPPDKPPDKGEDKAQKPEARSQTSPRADAPGSGEARARPPARRSRLVPDDWQPSEATINALQADGYGIGHIERELARMRDHEFKDPRADFDRAFRKWVRRDPSTGTDNVILHPRHSGHDRPASSRRQQDRADHDANMSRAFAGAELASLLR